MVSSIAEKQCFFSATLVSPKETLATKRDTLIRNAVLQENSESIKRIEYDLHKLNETVEEMKQSINGLPPMTGSETKQVPTWPVNANDIGPNVQSVRGLRIRGIPELIYKDAKKRLDNEMKKLNGFFLKI